MSRHRWEGAFEEAPSVKRLAVLPALAMALVPLATAIPTAQAATGDLSTVSITVSMDLPSESAGPAVWQVTDVPVGAGPELTGADLVSNPSDWVGSVTVDVDNTTHHITVATEDSAVFETATVTVTSADLGTISVVSDDLWVSPDKGATFNKPLIDATTTTVAAPTMPLLLSSDPGTASMDWTTSLPGTDWLLNPDGAAVFSYTVTAPTTTVAPTTTAPPAAAAVQATPAFTG